MRMRNINDRREQRVRARRCDDASAREKPRERPCNSAFTQLPMVDTAQGEKKGVGVMATCNNIVDSYCFVIGPCDATRHDASAPPSDAGAEYIVRRSFYWKFPAAHFGISAIFPFAWRTWRRGAFPHSLSTGARFFCAFFFFFFYSFLYFFFMARERHRVKFEAFE